MTPRNTVAIVTGASRGIGRAIAVALAEAGCRVAIHYQSRADQARETADAVAARGGESRLVQADAGTPEAAHRVVEATLEAFGRLDVLVNNAGISPPGAQIADVEPGEWERVLRVNVSGPLYFAQAALPHMRAQRSGSIINISSNVTRRLPARLGAYTASKSALEALTQVLAKEEGPYGIRVNAVAPGPIDTDMLRASLEQMGPDRADAFIRSVPLGRMGRPEEIASVVRFLASDAASYLTGQVIYVNGGGPAG